jgi:hypothetical protein
MKLSVLVEPHREPSRVISKYGVWVSIRFDESKAIELLLRVLDLVDGQISTTRAFVTYPSTANSF